VPFFCQKSVAGLTGFNLDFPAQLGTLSPPERRRYEDIPFTVTREPAAAVRVRSRICHKAQQWKPCHGCQQTEIAGLGLPL
jgi:hypothetical protein